MTSNRARLTAIALCVLLAIALCSLYLAMGTPAPEMKAVGGPMLVSMPAEPPSAPRMAVQAPMPARLDGADQRAAAGPDVSPAAAPGVAFNYRYAFRLAAPRIAGVQEQHARSCERLGPARCRITGLLYRVIDPRNVEARLELKLDPRIARHFGRGGVDSVVRAEGMLTESEISGTDAAAAILAAGRTLAELSTELARIEARLRALAAGATERPELDYQALQIRAQIRALRDGREAQQEALATTPMLFHYGSGELVPDSAEQQGLRPAIDRAIGNFTSGVGILLIVLITLLPWALAVLAVWLAARFVGRRWFPAAKPAA